MHKYIHTLTSIVLYWANDISYPLTLNLTHAQTFLHFRSSVRHYCVYLLRYFLIGTLAKNLITKTKVAHSQQNDDHVTSAYGRHAYGSPIAVVTPHVSQTALRSTFRSKPTKSLCFLSKGPSKSCNLMTSWAKHSLSHPWIHKTRFSHINASGERTQKHHSMMLNYLSPVLIIYQVKI